MTHYNETPGNTAQSDPANLSQRLDRRGCRRGPVVTGGSPVLSSSAPTPRATASPSA